jgi:four helix bundle protein
MQWMSAVAGVTRYRDLIAWQVADGFKHEVLTLLVAGGLADRDRRYRDQLANASTAVSKDIAEGFLRYSPAAFARFLDYALGSLGEAEDRMDDGVACGYFTPGQCAEAKRYARRAAVAIVRLKQSQRRYLASHPHGTPQDGPSERD